MGIADDSDGEKRGKKRPGSLSPSENSSGETSNSDQAKGADKYISPCIIAKIIRNKIDPKTLCQLSAMSSGTPSQIRKLVPNVSVKQICKMCELWENTKGRGKVWQSRRTNPKRSRRSISSRRRSRAKSPARSRRSKRRKNRVVDDKVDHKQKARKSAFSIPTPKKSE